MNRVVITGVGSVSPLGVGVEALMGGLAAGNSGVRVHPALAGVAGVRTRVAALVPEVDSQAIPRKYRRSMSPMSVYAVLASAEALKMAGVGEALLAGGEVGVAFGSTVGSPQAMEGFFRDYLRDHSVEQIRTTTFFQVMNHSVASNVAQAFGITGRTLAISSACSTSCQTVGHGYELVASGRERILLCGGADEFHPLTAATFDILNAASTAFNGRPGETPRPFDRRRDGIVCAEGGGALLLESLDSARARGARILAEILGFATVSDPTSVANPDQASIGRCMKAALEDAKVAPDRVGYVNAHATGTLQGDSAEGLAISGLFGANVPVSALKGHLGHAMAASGALELIAVIGMMEKGVLLPTRNLDDPDPACGALGHLQKAGKAVVDVALKNNFALGGVNSSLVMGRFSDG